MTNRQQRMRHAGRIEKVDMCPVCGASDVADTGRARPPREGSEGIGRFADSRIMRCGRCGLFYVEPRPRFSDEDCRWMYAGGYFVWRNAYWHRREAREIEQRLRRLMELAPSAGTFLDVGCGGGAAIEAAARAGLRPTGIDVSDNRRPGLPAHEFLSGDLCSLARDGRLKGRYDLVYMNSVLEHLYDPPAHLRCAARLLADGGCIFLGVPNEASLRSRFRRFLVKRLLPRGVSPGIMPLRRPYHLWGFTPESMRLAVRSAGLSVADLRMRTGCFVFLRNPAFSRGFLLEALTAPAAVTGAAMRDGYYLELYARGPGGGQEPD